MWYKENVLKKVLNIFISIFLLLPLFTEVARFPQTTDNDPVSFQKPCDMDDCDMDNCDAHMPKCPLCPSSGSMSLYLSNGIRIYTPIFTSSFNPISVDTLSDQGYVRSVFRPPTSIS